VLEWIVGRVEGGAGAVDSPIGLLPAAGAINSPLCAPADLEALLALEEDAWQAEQGAIAGHMESFEGRASAATGG